MFSGIIKGVGEIASYDHEKFRLAVRCPLFNSGIALGASIAVDGVCLTACDLDHTTPDVVAFDLGEETRKLTLLAKKTTHDLVNIEFSLRMGDSLDGHMVQGHVDGLAQVLSKVEHGGNLIIRFSQPKDLAQFLVHKGSVAINGVSLTINDIDDDSFSVCLVPFTIDNTSFKNIAVGDLVHIETDVVGRYLYRFAHMPNPKSKDIHS